MKKHTKYGRPPLAIDKKRTIEVCIMVNKSELEKLKTVFGKSNLRGKMRDYLLEVNQNIPNNGEQKATLDNTLVFQLKKIGVNLNQLLFQINLGGYPIDGETEALIKELSQLIKQKLT